MYLRHIPGAKNTVADWLSRMDRFMTKEKLFDNMDSSLANISCILSVLIDPEFHLDAMPSVAPKDYSLVPASEVPCPSELFDPTLEEDAVSRSDVPKSVDQSVEEQALVPQPLAVNAPEPEPQQQEVAKVWSPEEMFHEVHGKTKMHFGARRTWIALNRRFPGHKIPYLWIADHVAACPICQKDRLLMSDYIEPVIRHLKPTHRRQRVGVDNLTVTPKDAAGNGHLIVIVDHFSKYMCGYRLRRSTQRRR